MPRIDREARADIPAIEIIGGHKLRSGVPVVTGLMTAGLLVDSYDIPTYDARTRQGYQRPLQDSPVNELANDLPERARGSADGDLAQYPQSRSSPRNQGRHARSCFVAGRRFKPDTLPRGRWAASPR